ncbi:hypothetical protein ASPWEDRAFT_449874 [Aspergillus wentii DTO 134E9]|uniref:Uncharacterized protein n=1 Tax=Aspergillus wentii DTO 134E9 TaxID=1073089 RepID=A0A1L9RR65_ASPWE|nr:uncharacterized protein ASPWEDRAFT_449874 [Aspergillus wentii DTO 134E9]OJJ37363.1 hypothetical protein ASPWEDRAFT_449874 [Aspergillus wentii DTO 134E9]
MTTSTPLIKEIKSKIISFSAHTHIALFMVTLIQYNNISHPLTQIFCFASFLIRHVKGSSPVSSLPRPKVSIRHATPRSPPPCTGFSNYLAN